MRSLLRPAPELAGDQTIGDLFVLIEADEPRPSITIGSGCGREEPVEPKREPRDNTDELVDDALHAEAFGDER